MNEINFWKQIYLLHGSEFVNYSTLLPLWRENKSIVSYFDYEKILYDDGILLIYDNKKKMLFLIMY